MKLAILILSLMACKIAYTQSTSQQEWHPGFEKLIEPKSSSGYYLTVAYVNRYDTVPCTYIATGSTKMQKGFKYVYILHGYYTDNAQTYQVFFDDRMKRISNIERYSFR